VVILSYPDKVCSLTASKACHGPAISTIQGEKGWVEIQDSPGVCASVTLHKGGESKKLTTLTHDVETRMVYETEAFVKAIQTGDRAMMTAALDRSEDALWILTQAKAQAGLI